jgi:hypothetical protein
MDEWRTTIGPDDFRWPLTTIDFEASCLGKLSYPIEIGICTWEGPGRIARTWSTLIKPTRDWVERGVWSDESAKIHGISRHALHDGMDPREALLAANAFAKLGTPAYCDGGQYDEYWLARMAKAADGVDPLFHLAWWHLVFRAMPEEQRTRMTGFRKEGDIVHRAGPDAEDHVRSFAYALGVDEPDFMQVADPHVPRTTG